MELRGHPEIILDDAQSSRPSPVLLACFRFNLKNNRYLSTTTRVGSKLNTSFVLPWQEASSTLLTECRAVRPNDGL